MTGASYKTLSAVAVLCHTSTGASYKAVVLTVPYHWSLICDVHVQYFLPVVCCAFQQLVFNKRAVLYNTCVASYFVVFFAVNYSTLNCLTLLLCIAVPKNSLHAQCISTPRFDQLPHPLNALCVTYSNSTSPGLPKKVSQCIPTQFNAVYFELKFS